MSLRTIAAEKLFKRLSRCLFEGCALKGNAGKHIIISSERHNWLKRECSKFDVPMSEVADFAIGHLIDGAGQLQNEGALRAYLKTAAEHSELRKEREKYVAPPGQVEGTPESGSNAV